MAKNQQVKVNLLFGADTSAAVKNVEQLGRLLNQISTKTTIGLDAGPLAEAVGAAQQLQAHLQSALNQKTGKIDLTKLNKSLQSAGTDLSKLSSQLQALGPQGQQAFNRLAMAIASAEAPMFDLSKRMKDFMDTLGNTIKWSIASGAIHNIQGALQGAVSHAEKLNKALNDIRIVTGYNTTTMANFADEARRAAQVLKTTSTEYAQAALIFYQQGLKGTEVLERANTVVKLAQVTRESAEDVSSQMTAIWNNFADGSRSLEYYADALAKLGAATAASTDDISRGLSQFAAIADTVGLSYEYAAASIATVVDKTQQSAEVVGNAFKTVFSRIEGLSLGETLEDGINLNKYSEALAKVGVDILDHNGQLREMNDILDSLGDRWNLIGRESQVALAQTVGGARQYAQFISLMDNWKSVKENIELASKAQGELNQQQEIWAESIEGSEQRLRAAKDLLSEDLISDETIIAFNNGLADLLKGIDRVVDAAGGLLPIATMLIGVFSKQLFPIITSGFTRLKNNIDVLTGKAARDVADMQNKMRAEIQAMVDDGTITEAFKKQLELSDRLIAAKQKMAMETKNMTAAQKAEYERRMAVIEMMTEEAQKSLELQHQLEEEAKAAKEAAAARGGQTSRRLRMEAASQGMSIEGDDLDRAKQMVIAHPAGRLPTKETIYAKYQAQIDDLEKQKPIIGEAARNPASGKRVAEVEEQIKLEEKLNAQIEKINQEREKEIEILRIATELTERMHAVSTEDAVIGSTESDLVSSLQNKDLASQSVNKVAKGLRGEGFEVTKGETGKQVNLQSSLKNYEKLIKLQIKQSVETKKLVKINEDLKKVQDPKDLIKLLQKSEKEIIDLLGPSKKLSENFANLGGPEAEKALESILRKLKNAQSIAEDANITYEELASTMANDLQEVAGTEELDNYIRANEQLVRTSPELQAALQRLGVDLEAFGIKGEQSGQKFKTSAADVASFVGAISSLTMGIQSFGSAFEEGLTPMERFSAILGSIMMILPTLNTLMSTSVGLKIKETIASAAATIAKQKENKETKKSIALTIKENAVTIIKTILKDKWVGLALVGTALAVSASYAASAMEAEEAAIHDAAAASREAADANQEQADNNKELIKSFNDLYKQYKETGEISADLKAKTEELGKAYNLEGAALANLTGQYDTYIEKLRQARKEELNKLNREERSAALDAAASMAEALSEGTGYFEDGGMRFELDTGWGSGDAEIILDLARNSKGKSYGEFLSVNTSGINEVDMTVGNRNDPYEMQRFIASLRDYQQAIQDEAKRLGDDSVLNSSEYKSLVAQITEAEEAFGQLNTAIDNLNAVEAERMLLALSGLDQVTYSSYADLRNQYSNQVSNYLKEHGYIEGSDLYTQYYNNMMEQLFGYSSDMSKYETAYSAFNDLRRGKEVTGRSDNVDEIENYYKRLSNKDKELFWTLKIDASSTLDDLQEQMDEVRRQAILDTALENFNIGQSLLSALNSDNRDWEQIKKQFEELGALPWERFVELSQQEQIELINETNLKNAQRVLSSFQSDIERIEAKSYTKEARKIREAEENKFQELVTQNSQAQAVAEAMKLNTATSDGYQHHGNMANYLNQVAEAIGPEAMDEGRYEAFKTAEQMLRNLHDINTTQDLSQLNEDLAKKDWVNILNHFGGSDSQIGKAFAQWTKYHNQVVKGGTSQYKPVSMSAKESQAWKENIAKGALKGPQADGALKGSQADGAWILNSTATSEAQAAQDQVLKNTPTEIDFNQQKADSIAKIRTQYADALNEMRQYAEQQGVNTAQYDAAILAIEKFNEGIEESIYLVRLGAIGMVTYGEGMNSFIAEGQEWVSILQDENASLNDQIKILPALKEAMTKVLNITDSKFDALWSGGFFTDKNVADLMSEALIGNEQALLDLQLAAAKQLLEGDNKDIFLNNLQSHSLAAGTTVKQSNIGNQSPEENALLNRLSNAYAMGVSQDAIEALGYKLEIANGKLIGYTITAKGYTQENIDAIKELSKQATASITPYKEINDQLNIYNRQLEELGSFQDRLYGKSQLQALESEKDILEATNGALKEKVEWAKQYQEYYSKELSNFGINFENGYITNYTDIAAGLKNSGNYEDLEKLNELVNQYDEHLSVELDATQEIQENNYRILDIAKERLDIELETNQAITERSQELIELEKTLMEGNFYQMAELLSLMAGTEGDKASQYKGIINNLTDIESYYSEIQKLNPFVEGGNIANMANYAQGLETVQEGLLGNIEQLHELKSETKEYYSNVLQAAAEEINQYTDLMHNNTAVLEHYINVMDLVGKSTDYKRLGIILQGQAQIAKAQLDISKSNYELFAQEAENTKKQYEASIGTESEEWWRTQWMAAEQAAQTAQQQMMEDTEAWIEKEKSIIENGFKDIGQTLENALTGGTSFDSLTTAMDRAVSIQEEYLTTTNKIYETNKLMSTAQKEMDKTQNTVAKNKLSQFVNETKQLQGQAKLSQYELQIQQAKYDLLLAEIALEESQNAKSTVRLQRDASGNFGYIYTADQNAVDAAQQAVADKENALYNLGLQGANDYSNKYLSTMTEMFNSLEKLNQQRLAGAFETEAEYEEERAKLVQYYQEKLTQYSELYGISLTTDAKVVADAWSTTFMQTSVPMGEMNTAIQEYLKETDKLFANWTEIGTAAEKIFGSSMDNSKTKVNNVVSAVDELTNKLGGDNGVIDKVGELLDKFGGEEGLLTQMAALSSSIDGTITKYAGQLKNVNEELAKLAKYNGNLQLPSVKTVSSMKPEELQKTIAAALREVQINSPDGGPSDKTITDWKVLSPYYDALSAMVQSGYATSYENRIYQSLGSNLKAQQSDLDKIDIADFASWLRTQIFKLPSHINYDYYMYLLSQGKYNEIVNALIDNNVLSSFDSGGYTGEWGPEGRFAMVHEKELVLKPNDTANFLSALGLLDNIIATLDRHTASAQLGGLLSSPNFSMNPFGAIDQNVHIEASFPNVQDRNEIEEAFNNLVNKASQYANRK